jgi:NAD(P)-dependent dehydrogenase (short-subunit alcohol dehydrogenase family)
MNRKTFIVTGANSGLGLGVATLLAREDAHVVLLCRNPERGQAALDAVRSSTGNTHLELGICDLASQSMIRDFAADFKSRYHQLHGLFNCAGVHLMTRKETREGYEWMFATEYLGHFLLTNLLLDELRASAPARIVTISGEGHKKGVEGLRAGSIHFEDLHYEKSWDLMAVSKQVVVAKILFTYELARRLNGSDVAAHTICPGFTRTNLLSHYPWYVRVIGELRMRLARAQTCEEGASHIVWVGTAPELDGLNGRYFVQRKLAESSPETYNEEIASRLWHASEEMVGQRFNHIHAAG